MDFGRKLRRSKLSRWIWKFTRLNNLMNLVADLYDEYILVIGDVFICTNCAITFSDEKDGLSADTQAFYHIEEFHTGVVTPHAQD